MIRIPIHSVVDVITNSSTVVYTDAATNAIELAKELVNEVLAEAGSPKQADELFNFEVVREPIDDYDWLTYDVPEQADLEAKLLPLDGYGAWNDASLDWPGKRKAAREFLKKHATVVQELWNDIEEWDSWGESKLMERRLIVTKKDGTEAKFVSLVLDMFDTDSYYNG